MRRVELRGFVVYDEDELSYAGLGNGVASRIEDLLFNEDYPLEWSFIAVTDTQIDDIE